VLGDHADIEILDALASYAHDKKSDFLIMRYDGSLKCFGYLKGSDSLYNSSSAILNVDKYGIGSGAYCKMYKQHQENISARYPIRKIIECNNKAIKKAEKKANIKQSDHADVCYNAGGDHGTGGKIKMTTLQTDNNILQSQISVLQRISGDARGSNAVAVCSFDPKKEKEKLDKLGVSPDRSHHVKTKVEVDLIHQFDNQLKDEESHEKQLESLEKKDDAN
jgi:hypothetical protein